MPYTYKRNDFVKTKDQRELARFGLARTDDKPKERLSLLRLSRGAKEEDEVKTSVFIRTFLTPSKNSSMKIRTAFLTLLILLTTKAFASAQALEETAGSMNDALKTKFIEGNPVFMSIVAITLIVGLTFCIERVIYLALADINRKTFISKLETLYKTEGLNAAIEYCRNTRGPIASMCLQGLLHSTEKREDIERTVASYADVEVGKLEKGCVWITLCITIAPSLGFLGTVIGMVMSFDNIEMAGDISPRIVAGGMKVALITTIFGIISAVILQVFYNYILSRIEHITSQMEQTSIDLLEIISHD